jgi:hypothetical protein
MACRSSFVHTALRKASSRTNNSCAPANAAVVGSVEARVAASASGGVDAPTAPPCLPHAMRPGRALPKVRADHLPTPPMPIRQPCGEE